MKTFLSVLATLALLTATVSADVPLVLGTTVTGSLDTPGSQQTYTFIGTPGQRVVFDSLLAEATQIYATLKSPIGTAIWSQNAQNDSAPLTLIESGTYSLLIDGAGPAVGPFTFRLLDVASQPELVLDDIFTDTLTPGNSVRIYRLEGSAGQRLYFDALDNNAGGNWYFYGINNAYLAGSGIGADFEITLPQSGSYILGLFGSSPTPVLYSFQAVTSAVNLHALTLGANVAGAITNPGDQEVYTFAGTPGQRVIYDALDGDNLPVNARFIHPSGSVLWEQNSDSDVAPFTLVDPGTYSLVIDGIGAATGPYRFRLLDASKLPAIALDVIVSETLSPGISAKVYRLEGTAGQRLFLDGLGANVGADWYLYGPNNAYVASCGIGVDFETTLPLTGTYLLAAWGRNAGGPLPFSVQIITAEVFPGTVTPGSTINGVVAEPGEQHLYTFTGAIGQRIYYDSLDSDSEQIYTRLTAPSGAVVWDNSNQSTDVGPVTLLENGVYSLLIDGSQATVGDFRFRLLDLAVAPPLFLGGTTTGSLNPANATLAYQINGTAGQRLNFDNLSATLNQAYWRLVGPMNQNVVAHTGITTDIGDVVLPVTGTYHLLVEGYTDNIAPLQFQFIATDKSEAPVAVSGLGTVLSGAIAAGQLDTNSFTAPAGLPVYFDSQDRSSPGSLYAELRDPLDAVVFTVNAYTDAGPYVLPRSGTYRLILKGSSAAATGTYRYRLLNLSESTTAQLPLNTIVSSNLDPGYQTDVYRLTGQAAQRLAYDSLENDFANVVIRMLMPDGLTVRFLNGNSDTDVAPFTLPVSGTYRIFVESVIPTPATYRFRLLNVEAQPSLPFNALVSLTLDPGLGTQIYRFEGIPGQRLYFDGLPSNGAGSWNLYGPNNQLLGGTGLTGDFELVPTTPGRYVLAISGNSPAPVPATFEVFSPGSGTPVNDLRITSVEVTGAGVILIWDSKTGLKYRIQYKTALADVDWTDLPGDVTASGNSSTKTDTTNASNPMRFYQVITVP